MRMHLIAEMREVGDEIKGFDNELRSSRRRIRKINAYLFQISLMKVFQLVKQRMIMLS